MLRMKKKLEKRVLFVGFERDSSNHILAKLNTDLVHPVGFVIKDVNEIQNLKKERVSFYERKPDADFLLKYQSPHVFDTNLADSHYLNDSMVLHVLFRHFSSLESLRYDLLKQKLISYSHAILLNTKPDLVSFNVTPHDPVAFVLYRICKYLGIDTLIYHKSLIFNSFYVCNEIGNQNQLVLMKGNNKSQKDVGDIVHSIFNSFLRETPKYMLKQQKTLGKTRSRLVKTFFASNKPSFKRLRGQIEREREKNYYESICEIKSENDLGNYDKPIVYFPLHYQPEHTTIPNGLGFAQQWRIIEWIRHLAPSNFILVIKEHPSQFFLRPRPQIRSTELYQSILNQEGIVFCSTTVSSKKIMDKSKAVLTISGTAGLEALLMFKPVAIFGDSPVFGFPGTQRVSSFNALEVFFEDILIKTKDLNQYEIRNTIVKMLNSDYLYLFGKDINSTTKQERLNARLLLLYNYLKMLSTSVE